LIPQPKEHGLSTIKVASYNIHRCIGSDGCRDAERIAKVIREFDAHIIGLQEVDSRRMAETEGLEILAYLTGFTAIPGPTMQLPDGNYGNVLLTAHAVADIQHVDLTAPGREPRGAIDARLKIHGRPVRVITTHLGLKAGERRYQARKLIGRVSDNADDLTVLMGDINEWFPLSPLILEFHRRFGKPPTLLTFPSHWPCLALDRIWVRPGRALQKLSTHKSLMARIASDHLPLVAHIDLLE
jgi:endonuclease/exonuclease/phosphatase family metal-dependent hydrolase